MTNASYVLRQAAFALVLVFLAITLNFVIFRLAPGDATRALGQCRNCTTEFRESLEVELGLDKSKLEQFGIYLSDLVQGNLGRSFVTRQPVSSLLFTALRNTLPMLIVGVASGMVLGTTLGVIAAWRRGTMVDSGGLASALILYSLPTQWVGLMLIFVFAGTLPTAGISDPFVAFTDPGWWPVFVDRVKHLILPSLTLANTVFGEFALIVRSSLLETLGEDYILTARAKGLSSWTIVRKHAFRNALLPIVTLAALSVGFLLAGTLLIEAVFSYPGIGLATYDAVILRDYPVLQGSFLLLTLAVIGANFVADLLYFKIDPRVAE